MSILNKIKLLDDKKSELEKKKEQLLEKRKLEVASIVEKTKTLGLDNTLIIGALLYAKEIYEENSEESLARLRKLAEPFQKKIKGIGSSKKS